MNMLWLRGVRGRPYKRQADGASLNRLMAEQAIKHPLLLPVSVLRLR